MEDDEAYDEACDGDKVVAPALLAVDPLGKFVVVAVGCQLRVYDLIKKCRVDAQYPRPQPCHKESIRTITFSQEGKLFVSAGDDKHVKLWDTESWQCKRTVHSNKKVSAAAFSSDSEWLLYADKFGIVYAQSTKFQKDLSVGPAILDQPVNLLAHCCSIITSLKCTADGKYIVTADRDFKIRVSMFPKDPLLGAHEIQGFCLGHESFVSCLAVVEDMVKSQLLVSGGGDGTVRLWDIKTSTLLDTADVSEVGTINGDCEMDTYPQASAITCVSVSHDGSLIAVGRESFDGVIFLECDTTSKRLRLLKRLELAEHFCPTSIEFDTSGRLWLVAGAAQIGASCTENAVTWVKIVSYSSKSPPVFTPIELVSLSADNSLSETLDGTDSASSKALALAEAANIAVKNALSKRHYTLEQREFRKRTRNDKKLQRK